MRSLDGIIRANARAAGREAGHADTDGNDRLAERIHAAAIEHVEQLTDDLLEPQRGGPDINDESYPWFATGFLNGRKDG